MRSPLLVLVAALALLFGARVGRAEMPPLWMLARSLPAAAPRFIAAPSPGAGTPGLQCRAAIEAAERQGGIPPHLMAAIGRVESGRRDDATGRVDPWPWSINAAGLDHVYQTKGEAIAAVRAFQTAGVRSIDVGCMQVSLLFHPDAFASLDDAFDPARNAAYAARFLAELRAQTGSWQTATAWYHSATPELGADYQRRVMAVLPEEEQRPAATPARRRRPPDAGHSCSATARHRPASSRCLPARGVAASPPIARPRSRSPRAWRYARAAS